MEKNQIGINNIGKQKKYNIDRMLKGNAIQKSYTQPRYHSKTSYLQWKKNYIIHLPSKIKMFADI